MQQNKQAFRINLAHAYSSTAAGQIVVLCSSFNVPKDLPAVKSTLSLSNVKKHTDKHFSRRKEKQEIIRDNALLMLFRLYASEYRIIATQRNRLIYLITFDKL